MLILEKMGTPDIIKYIIDDNIKNIINSLNNCTMLKINIDNRKLKAVVYIKFKIDSNYKANIDYNNCLNSDFKNCNININYIINYNLSDVLRSLTHELTHIYELYNVKDIIKTTKWSWQDALNKTKSQNRYGLISYLRDMIYLSLPQELNARVSSIYFFLLYQCNSDMNKQDILNTLKGSNEWKNYLNLIDFSIDNLLKDLVSSYDKDIDILYYMLNELNNNIGLNIKIKSVYDLENYLNKLDKIFKKYAKIYKVKLFKVMNRVYSELNEVTKESSYEEPDDVSYNKYIKNDLDISREYKIDNLLEYKEYINELNDMRYLKLFENFKDSDNIKDTIEDIFYEFSDLRVDVTKRLNTNDNYRVVVENKIESTLDNDESDLYRHWNYFENKGELNERFIQLFKYMYDEGYSPKVSYSKIIGDGGFVDSPYYIKAVNQFDVIHMGINTPRELYNNFAEDERLVKVEIIFYKDGRVVNESAEYKYGCVMIETPFDNWTEITSIIDEQDLYNEPGDNTYGIQNNPHVTLLYGLHKEVTPEMVESALEGFNGSKININGVGIFENENFDVVKLNVDPIGSLQVMHDKLCEFPNTSDYPVYEPHITIGYVKKGLGKKYVNSNYRDTRLVDRVCYSMTNGEKIYFNL